MSCKYNAAFDVQRMNVNAESPDSVLREPESKGDRFVFARDNPDLVMSMLNTRTELHMRMVDADSCGPFCAGTFHVDGSI